MQPDERLPSYKRVERHLEHMRKYVSRRVRANRNRPLILSEAVKEMWRIAFRRIRQ